jgi:hypothetical protein
MRKRPVLRGSQVLSAVEPKKPWVKLGIEHNLRKFFTP